MLSCLACARLHSRDAYAHAVIKQADLTATELIGAVANAERERAAMPGEVPVCEWEAVRIKPDYSTHLTTQALLANSEEAKTALQVSRR